jgi:hypothetical protein
VDNMGRRQMYIEVSYKSEDSNERVTQTKKELKEEKKRVLNYIKELIDFDFHEKYKLKIKELIFEE